MILKLLTCSLLLLSPIAGAQNETRGSEEERDLLQFKNMITCLQPQLTLEDLSIMIDYGCWCGDGGTGITVDETDKCCRTHDGCYGRAVGAKGDDTYLFGVPHYESYNWDCIVPLGQPGTVRCDELNRPLPKAACECDKAAAECFKEKRGTFTLDHYNIDYEQCCKMNPPGPGCNVKKAKPTEDNVKEEASDKTPAEENDASNEETDASQEKNDASQEEKSATLSLHGSLWREVFVFAWPCVMALFV